MAGDAGGDRRGAEIVKSRHLLWSCLAAVAVGCGPPTAIEIAPGASPELARVESVFLDSALEMTGPERRERDLRNEVEARLAGRVSIAPLRDEADVLLLFELSDRLDCFGCNQSEDRWHWWGFVFDSQGRELASLHGETSRQRREGAVQQFVGKIGKILKRGRKTAAARQN